MQKCVFIPAEKIYGDFILLQIFHIITSVGGLIGWQWFPGDQFAIGLGIGVDYYFFSGEDDDFSDINGTAPALRFDIGYAW